MNYWQSKINAAKAKAAAKRRKTRLGLLMGGLLATAGAAGGVHLKHGANTARQNAFLATLTQQRMGLHNLPVGKMFNRYGKILTLNFTPINPNRSSFYYVNGKQVPFILKGPNNKKYIQRNGSLLKLEKVQYDPWAYKTNGEVKY